MENASKALIIAGAILLSIIIISLGLIVVNSARENVTKYSDMTQQELENHNSKFTTYEGAATSGVQVNSLIQTIISSNQAEKVAGTERYVTGEFTAADGTTSQITGDGIKGKSDGDSGMSKVAINGMTYKVVFSYTEGAVSGVSINVNS